MRPARLLFVSTSLKVERSSVVLYGRSVTFIAPEQRLSEIIRVCKQRAKLLLDATKALAKAVKSVARRVSTTQGRESDEADSGSESGSD